MACRPTGSGCAHTARRILALLLILITTPAGALAGDGESGSSNRNLREEAQQAVPWASLSKADRSRIGKTVAGASLYRRLPTRVIDCDPDMFAYLIDHPELVVEVWGVMGISKLSVERLGSNRFRATDSTGTMGDVRVAHRSGGGAQPLVMVTHAEGVYEAPPMPAAIRASSVMLLRAEPLYEANGRVFMRTRLDSFVRFDQPTASLIAKTLQPLVMKTADHNFVETMRFVSQFSRTAEQNPAGVAKLAEHLTKIDEATRSEFVRVCYRTAGHETSQGDDLVWVRPYQQPPGVSKPGR